MDQDEKAQEGQGRERMKYRQRWRRDSIGALRYVGACPFNNAVCKLMNVFAPRKQEG